MDDASTSAEVVASRIREAILSGELPPGERLHQDNLAETLGVSRTPLRTALAALAQSGLVAYESNRGFYVRGFSFADVVGAFQVRAELEATACLLAAGKMTAAAERHLHDLVEEGDRLLSSGTLLPDSLAPYRRMNVNFHTTVMDIAGNPWIRSFVDTLHNVPLASDRVIMWREFEVLSRSHDDHHRIAHALKRGQGERAAAIMREHITFALEHLQSQMEKYPEDFLRVPMPEPTAKRSRANKQPGRSAK